MDKNKLQSIKVLPSCSIKEAINRLNDTGEKIIFVAENNNKLLGTITDGDIRRAIINNATLNDKVDTIMYRNPVIVLSHESDYKAKAKNLMALKKIEHVPVLDNEGTIEDLILWTDFLQDKTPSISKKKFSNQVVVMAGGKGSRLDPFTRIFPKPLIPIGNKTAIEVIMEGFFKFGFHKFIYSLNYKKEYLKLFFKENKFPYEIDWVEEENFLGTAGSLCLLKDKIADTFFVINCDSILDLDFDDVLVWHREHKAAITIIGSHREVNIPFGVLKIEEGQLGKILEKPVQDVIINTGAYVMEPHVLSLLKEENHLDMNKFISLVAEKEKIAVYPIYNGWFDLGQWEEYQKTVKHFEGRASQKEY